MELLDALVSHFPLLSQSEISKGRIGLSANAFVFSPFSRWCDDRALVSVRLHIEARDRQAEKGGFLTHPITITSRKLQESNSNDM